MLLKVRLLMITTSIKSFAPPPHTYSFIILPLSVYSFYTVLSINVDDCLLDKRTERNRRDALISIESFLWKFSVYLISSEY